MIQDIKIPLLRSMGEVFDRAKGGGMTTEILVFLKDDLATISDYFKVNAIQSFLISHVFALSCNGYSADYKDIIRHIDCNPLKILEFSDEMKSLVDRGILIKEGGSRRTKDSLSSEQYIVNIRIVDAILSNSPMPADESPVFNCFVDLLDKVNYLNEQLRDEMILMSVFDQNISHIIRENDNFPIIKLIKQQKLSITDSYMYLILIWETLTGNEEIGLEENVKGIFTRNSSRKIRYIQSFLKESNPLCIHDLIKVIKGRFINDANIALSDKSMNILEEMGLEIKLEKQKRDNVLVANGIAAKELYFNSLEERQLNMLERTLEELNFSQLQQRMRDKNLPLGVTVLFHGEPGTGKTESVLQIARKTGRDIFKVDISQTKSMWFGESEKIIKRVFNEYKSFAAKSLIKPILLFNEADAIISKRKDSSSSNVAQTENAIQNIILEELEKFEGIFMATTNLVNNMDKAFDRRFLFKVEFSKPDPSVKAKIWNSKIPWLDESQALKLASEFDFSGGQIDNIVRKCETHNIVFGETTTPDNIREFCRAEILHGKGGRMTIGY